MAALADAKPSGDNPFKIERARRIIVRALTLMAQARIAGLFGTAPEGIHTRSPFLGGFGFKGLISGPQILGIVAARLVGRLVKLVLRREQMFGPVGHRAPGEAPGSAALESAVDGMALACGMDPLAFRLKTYADVEPISGKPFSSEALRHCYEAGRRAIRLGHGHGGVPGADFQGQARVALRQDGTGVAQTGAHDEVRCAKTARRRDAARRGLQRRRSHRAR